MALERMRLVMAQMLTDPDFHARFMDATPGAPEVDGLSKGELEALRSISPDRMRFISEGYILKRLEPMESLFPWTLRFLRAMAPGSLPEVAAKAPMTAEAFSAYLGDLDIPGDSCRLLLDLCHLDHTMQTVQSQGPLPEYRFRPERLRPRLRSTNLRCRFKGPLHTVVPHLPVTSDPIDYPADATECLLEPQGSIIRLVPIDGETDLLLSSCTGDRTVQQIVEDHGSEAEPVLRGWFRSGILIDSS